LVTRVFLRLRGVVDTSLNKSDRLSSVMASLLLQCVEHFTVSLVFKKG